MRKLKRNEKPEKEDREKFYFKLSKECLKEQTETIKSYQRKTMRTTIIVIALIVGIVELLEIIKSLLVNAYFTNRVIAVKD